MLEKILQKLQMHEFHQLDEIVTFFDQKCNENLKLTNELKDIKKWFVIKKQFFKMIFDIKENVMNNLEQEINERNLSFIYEKF